MKHIIKNILSVVGAISLSVLFVGWLQVSAAPINPTYGGGLGTSTLPALGSIPCGVTSTSYGVLAVGSNGQYLGASSTAPCGVYWTTISNGTASTTNVYGTNGVTVTQVGANATASINEAFSNTWTVPQQFTSLNASGTVTIATTTASGTVAYGFTTDQSSFLNLNVTGNSPGSGSTGTLQEYNILEQNCPVGTSTTSGQGECTISQSLTNPYGLTGRVFVDHTLELYAPTYLWGDFITATQSSTLPEYVVEFSDHTNNHSQPFTITPVNSSTNSGFTIGIGNSGSTANITANTNITGNQTLSGTLSVGTTTSNGNLYVSSAGTQVTRLNRGANTNFNLLAFSTAGTDDWNFGEQNNSTNNFVVQDAANGGTVIQAIQNGTTTLGVSGTGKTVVSGVAFVASTTLAVNQISTFSGTVQVNSNNLVDAAGNKYVTSTVATASGAGNLFVSPTSSVLANNVATFQTAASSTIKATSSIYNFNDADVSINTSTDNGLLNITNASNTNVLTVASTTGNSLQLYVYSPVQQTSTVMIGATSTSASTYRTGCLEMAGSDVATSSLVWYLDIGATGNIQVSSSTCL